MIMKKVILFENRPERQKIYLPNGEMDIEKLKSFDFLTFYEDDIHGQLISKGDFEFLNDFNLLIFHRSYLVEFKNGSKLNPIYDFCRKSSKELILFTGGVSDSTYIHEGGFQSLTVSASEFYSKIMEFLPNYSKNNQNVNILELKYGKNWELVFLLQLRELMAILKQDISKELNVQGRFDYLVDLLDLTGIAIDLDRLWSVLNDKIKMSLSE